MARYLKKSSLPITLVILVVAAMFTFRGEAQQEITRPAPAGRTVLKPTVAYPVAAGTSTAVRDMKPAADIDAATLEDFERRVVNQLNVELDVPGTNPSWKLPSFDAAIAGRPTSGSAPQPSSVTPPSIFSFEGISDLDNANVGLGQVNPPDTNADVSFTQIVETVNSSLRVYNKSGVPLTPVIKQSQLFAALGGQ